MMMHTCGMSGLTDIGAALVDARKSSGLTQADLAGALGVHRQQVQRWESTRYRSASLERAGQVAHALGFDALILDGHVRAARAQGRVVPGDDVASPACELGEVVARIRAHGDELRGTYGLSKLGVFGSFVDARQTEDSDVDCLVEFGDSPSNTSDLAEYLNRILGRKVDVTTVDRLRWEIRADVSREVIRVWAA
jgi:predicted nucleotidyltransferase/DNA-binding XRE family transcriptional regulator